MPGLLPNKPRLPPHFDVEYQPPDESGEEALVFTSARRRVVLKGTSLRDVQRGVLPLLDGGHTLDEVSAKTAALLPRADLEDFLKLLFDRRLLQDSDPSVISEEVRSALAPQLGFFHELGLDAEGTQAALARATVAVVGLGGAGAHAAAALAAAGLGTVRCIDAGPVRPTDAHLAPNLLPEEDTGRSRAEALITRLRERGPGAAGLVPDSRELATDEDVEAAITGADFVLCCLDAGLVSVLYRVNRVCFRARLPWISCAVSGFEATLGPTVIPGQTPCYLCYQMRAVACSGDPPATFARLRSLDRRASDESNRRENHPFAAGLAGHLVGLEAFRALSGVGEPAATGRVLTFNLLDVTATKHVVLRRPDCPVCGRGAALADTRVARTATPE